MTPGARRLLRPWWLVRHVVVLAVLVATVNLGFWQLRRLDERQAHNALVAARADEPVVGLMGLLVDSRGEVAPIEHRTATAFGRFDTSREVYVANRSQHEVSGYHVVTLFELAAVEEFLVVNRGFVSRGVHLAGNPGAWAAPDGWVEVTGLVVAGGTSTGAHGDEVAAIDLADLEARWGIDGLLPAVLQSTAGAAAGVWPEVLVPPEQDEGPHFSYAMQWFLFTLIGVFGYPLLLLTVARRPGDPADPGPGSDGDPALA